MDDGHLDDIICRLRQVREQGYSKKLPVTEVEIQQLCVTAKNIFLQQPNLIELDPPIKICAALIAEKILCVHGGISPELSNLEQIKNLPRPTDVPEKGLLCDLLWSDPDRYVAGWGINKDRGISYTFGADVVSNFLDRLDLDLICRAHQVVQDGYEFFADRRLVTVFSAPNYCGEFDNAGAMLTVDESLMCSFQIINPIGTWSTAGIHGCRVFPWLR